MVNRRQPHPGRQQHTKLTNNRQYQQKMQGKNVEPSYHGVLSLQQYFEYQPYTPHYRAAAYLIQSSAMANSDVKYH